MRQRVVDLLKLLIRSLTISIVITTIAGLGRVTLWLWIYAGRGQDRSRGAQVLVKIGDPCPDLTELPSSRVERWKDTGVRKFTRSPFGASLRGTRDQSRRMTALGYNVWLIRFLAILFSGFWSVRMI